MIDGGQLKAFADTDYRLDGQGERPGQDAGHGETHPRKHGYPPHMQEKATRTVLEQADLMAEGLAV